MLTCMHAVYIQKFAIAYHGTILYVASLVCTYCYYKLTSSLARDICWGEGGFCWDPPFHKRGERLQMWNQHIPIYFFPVRFPVGGIWRGGRRPMGDTFPVSSFSLAMPLKLIFSTGQIFQSLRSLKVARTLCFY